MIISIFFLIINFWQIDCNVPFGEVKALHALYNSTTGETWLFKNEAVWGPSWNFSKVVIDPCDDGGRAWQDLRSYSLTGTIPDDLDGLSYLKLLDLSDNSIRGQIPVTIGNMFNLSHLSMHTTSLTGTIPIEMGSLTQLEFLHLRRNLLRGNIPTSLGQLELLTFLSLDRSALSGPIPHQLSRLTNLVSFSMYRTSISGAFPTWIGELSRMEYLSLHDTRLSGSIPTSIAHLTRVSYLFLFDNSLNGPIPDEIGNLVHAVNISLRQNHLTGTIPAALGNLSSLRTLYLQGNSLTGPLPFHAENCFPRTVDIRMDLNMLTGELPPNIGTLWSMERLSLYGNLLSGTIPSTIGSLTTLQYLYFYGNYLSGNIPSEIGSLSNMRSLTMDRNQFTGSLPSAFGKLSALDYLYVYGNYLTSTLPTDIGLMLSLVDLSLHHNFFSGVMPSSIGNLSALLYMSAFDNRLSGELPSAIDRLSELLELNMGNNELTGTISEGIGELIHLTTLELNDNKLTGSIPSPLGRLQDLQRLNLAGNFLTGRLGDILWQVQNMSLVNVDFSDNQLLGNIPGELFMLPDLKTVALTSNCFTGSLPNEMCLADKVQVYSMDMLGAARKGCKHHVHIPFTGVVVRNQLQGSVPACFWNFSSSIAVLSLTGNGLSGTVGSLQYSSESLVNLSLSYNHFTGAIPKHFLHWHYQDLDLSYNEITGDCASLQVELGNEVNKSHIALHNNRLSGRLPSSLGEESGSHIIFNILSGNIFDCATMLDSDKYAGSYTCGSSEYDQAIYMMLGVLGFFTVGLLYYVAATTFGISQLHRQGHGNVLIWSSLQRFRRKIESYLTYSSLMPSKMVDTSSIIQFTDRLKVMERMIIAVAVCGFVLCLPIYIIKASDGAEDPQYTTYTHTYRWFWTTAFVTGEVPAAILLAAWGVSVSVFVCYMTLRQRSSFRTALAPRQKDGPTSLLRLQWRRVAAMLGLIMLNFAVVGTVNGLYIWSIFRDHALSKRGHVAIQLSLAVFKYAWNFVITPSVVLGFLERPDERVWIRLLVLLANTLVIPCIVTSLTSSSCYAGLLVEQPPITSSYSYVQCEDFYISDGFRRCLSNVMTSVSVVPVIPPFIYHYECSSVVLKNYLPVFLYTHCFLILALFVRHYLAMMSSYGKLPTFLRPFCAGIMWPSEWKFTNFDLTESNEEVPALSEHHHSQTLHENVPRPPLLIKAEHVITCSMHHISVLLTFGLCSLWLTVAIVCSAYFSILHWRYLIGRFVYKRLTRSCSGSLEAANPSDISGASCVREYTSGRVIDADVGDIAQVALDAALGNCIKSFDVCMWPVIWTSAFFFAFLCWDMAGDRVGWSKAIWLPICALSFPCLVYVTLELVEWYADMVISSKKIKQDNGVANIELTAKSTLH